MGVRTLSVGAQAPRDPSQKSTDRAALLAIAQAAVEVELFTIPLYMASMYSIQGMHQITSHGSDFYTGRLWPGSATTAQPTSANERAFNVVFSVFIQEMLHLQLASNIATAVGCTPNYTSSALQTDNNAWTCYGPTVTVIPHIIDLRDTITFSTTFVDLGPLTAEQLNLFLAIEQPDADARKDIAPDKVSKYFPTAPFAGWQVGDPLPMFGTIGWMYDCYYSYLKLEYSDGTTLWDAVYSPGGQQNDLFNDFVPGHPMREFMGFESTVALTYSDIAFGQIVDAIDAITDQGEGSTLPRVTAGLAAVEERYRPTIPALQSDYPTYTDTGALAASADAVARGDNDGADHYERFQQLSTYVDEVVTWPVWLEQHGPWTAGDLQAPDYQPTSKYNIPTTAEVAEALNAVAADAGAPGNYQLLSQASIGALAGVTTVLDKYWNASAQAAAAVPFPFPSMAGSGDRMAICWAVFGKAPDLSLGLDPPQHGVLYHSCQALDYTASGPNAGTNQCAPVTVFHACKGSNGCQARGGCGFVQPVGGGGNCSTKVMADTAIGMRTFGGGCNPFAGPAYSAPGDNKCATFGGCAVPISASQLFPKSGTMDLFSFSESDGEWSSTPVTPGITFAKGQNVHDVAWAAYRRVMNLDADTPAPPPTAIRLAFPPST